MILPAGPSELTAAIKAEALRLGFDLAGVCPAVATTGIDRFQQWLAAGYGGEMHYLADRAAAYEHPRHVMDGVRSIVLLAMVYRTSEPHVPQPGQGRIARYAWGTDYHDVLRARLNQLSGRVAELSPGAKVRGVVDTAPLMERELAQLAGLGWIGKNTLLLNKQLGSWFFLAALLTDLTLEYDDPHAADHCGTCRACLDACPTDAFVAPYVLDSRRCISYLTIELKTAIPADLRTGVGDWILGCDVCQDVCPWNHRAPITSEPAFEATGGTNPLDLLGLFALDDAAFRQRFRHTPLWRPKRRGLLRNAAMALGNQRHHAALEALLSGLSDGEALVRGACAWALGQLATSVAKEALKGRLTIEMDDEVRAEIQAALTSPDQ